MQREKTIHLWPASRRVLASRTGAAMEGVISAVIMPCAPGANSSGGTTGASATLLPDGSQMLEPPL